MGLPFSIFSKLGLPGISSVTSGQVYDRHFKERDTHDFPSFHIAFVDFCKYFNTVLPGQDFDTPSLDQLKEFYEKEWVGDDDAKKNAFIDYMKRTVRQAKVDDSLFLLVGLAAPAAGVVVKRAGESIPQVKKFKLHYVPNVVFVPLWTLVAIMGVTAIEVNKKTAIEVNKKSKPKSPAP